MQIERLSHWGVIEVSGEDARTFLQSQLTQDVASLSPDRATLAAYCTAKGRMLGQFLVIRAADRLLLLTHAAMADALVKRLGMFVLRLKCKLRNASDQWRVIGLRGSATAGLGFSLPALPQPFEHAVINDGQSPGHLIGWPQAGLLPRSLLICSVAQAESLPDPADVPFWAAEDIRCGIPFLEPENVEVFVPQMLNLDAIGGVSFTKGCYPGQEVVARSHYLGKMKRRMFLASCDTLPMVGADIHASTHPTEPAGRIVNAARDETGMVWVLFEISSDLLEGASLHASAPDGPVLNLQPLPYALPASARSA